MKAAHVGMITTAIVVVLSVVTIIPAFTQQNAKPEVPVMLVFDINDDNAQNLPAWCTDLSASLEGHNVRATVFISGKLAEQYPQCVAIFSSSSSADKETMMIDVGSKTYSYANLILMQDYTQALEEVRKGKDAVDRAGGDIDSRLFRAPYGSTDQNIYSMLSRSGIVADFSYSDHYNTYRDGNFVRFNVTSFEGAKAGPEPLLNLDSRQPVMVIFDNNSVPISEVDKFIDRVMTGHHAQYDPKFVNASDLAQMQLTLREKAEEGEGREP
ncbi:putative xylanase/chitin deacetylase [Candidatus Nitrososphaera evergladensis SR1]|uniref:Putative xylanase/chitin deacetylase n=1 Tax=Candidatus Nitrososphaera evergladensis SR1 TaxID=1459636 RepID=A0A075MSR2_9ARCH|nr:polysaccharide deacetylase family protein [Candidatus Nitrososphaera evergladensis]AIF82389.1 putative xylanase/chitin deacetylase [Candidatus Nitrososphaera evergladensis SR1]